MLRKFGIAALCLVCAACGGKTQQAAVSRTSQPAPAQRVQEDAAAFKQGELAELTTAPAPDGVDPALWRVLKTHLADLLASSGKAVRSAPSSAGSAARLVLNSGTHALSWGYNIQGDYDQNGEVNIADLQPLGVHYGQSSGGGPFPVNSIQAVIDGDGNGEINLADLQPIGVNYGRQASAFNVYSSTNFADFPSGPSALNGSGAVLVASVPRTAGIGVANQTRLQYSFDLPAFAAGTFYWVRPSDGTHDGTASNVVSQGAGGNAPPLAALTADPLTGEAPLAVNFDASTSSDPDGAHHDLTDIVQYQWDFDGDGNFDQTTSVPTASHTFNAPGSYSAGLRVTDADGALSPLAHATVSAALNGNLPPVPALSADKVYGHASFDVTLDASATTDDAGTAALDFAWDYDGDGTYDHDSGNLPAASHTYSSAGAFTARVKVTDAAGLSAVATVQITVGALLQNIPPVARLTADNRTAVAPLVVTFDCSGSSDPDGSVVLYELDYDGDGTYDLSSATLPVSPQHTYAVVGVYYATLRVTDNLGTAATTVYDLRAQAATHIQPTASAMASPLTGVVPLDVTIDASASTAAGGSIIDYSFDYDDNGVSDDHGLLAVRHHTFVDAGTHLIYVYVTSNTGDESAYVAGLVNVVDPTNQPPSAQLSVTLDHSIYPEVFTLDASASTDNDGTIVSYNWDFDNDGTYDQYTGPVSFVTRPYGQVGSFTPTVQIQDNDGAITTATAAPFSVDDGWQTPAIADQQTPVHLATELETYNIGGTHKRALVAYCDNSATLGPVVLVSKEDHFDAWETPVQLLVGIGTGPVALTVTSGLPALIFTRSGAAPQGGLSFVLSRDVAASSWLSPVSVSTTGADSAVDIRALQTAAGMPAVISINNSILGVDFTLANDALGTGWAAPVKALSVSGLFIEGLGTTLLDNGHPAVATALVDVLTYKLSDQFSNGLDDSGSTWSAVGLPLGPTAGLLSNSNRLGCAAVDGRPAVVLAAGGTLEFNRADDATGSAWPAPLVIDQGIVNYVLFHDINLLVVDGKPVVIAADPAQDVVAIYAKDNDGLVWDPPVTLDSAGNVGESCCAATDGSRIVVAYRDTTNNKIKVAYR